MAAPIAGPWNLQSAGRDIQLSVNPNGTTIDCVVSKIFQVTINQNTTNQATQNIFLQHTLNENQLIWEDTSQNALLHQGLGAHQPQRKSFNNMPIASKMALLNRTDLTSIINVTNSAHHVMGAYNTSMAEIGTIEFFTP